MSIDPFLLFGTTHTDRYHVSSRVPDHLNYPIVLFWLLLKPEWRRECPNNHLPAYLPIDVIHGFFGHISHATQQEYPTIRIVLVMPIEGWEEAATGNSLRKWFREQSCEQIQQPTVADDPLGLLVKFIQFTIFLQLHQMVNIRSHDDTLPQFFQQLLLGCCHHLRIQYPNLFHFKLQRYSFFPLLPNYSLPILFFLSNSCLSSHITVQHPGVTLCSIFWTYVR